MPTIDQIKDGKHLYRCLESYFGMCLALYRCCILAFMDSNQKTEKDLKGNVVNAITEVSKYNSSKTDVIKDSHRKLPKQPSKLPILLSCRKNLILIYPTSEEFDSHLSNQ